MDLPAGYDWYGGRERTHVVRLADAAANGINDFALCGQPCVPRFGPTGFPLCATCARLLDRTDGAAGARAALRGGRTDGH